MLFPWEYDPMMSLELSTPVGKVIVPFGTVNVVIVPFALCTKALGAFAALV